VRRLLATKIAVQRRFRLPLRGTLSYRLILHRPQS
jgi:hypothetical protein